MVFRCAPVPTSANNNGEAMEHFSSNEYLLARQYIVDSIYRYCRAMDRIDRELGLSLWTDDAILDYGPIFRGPARDFIERACSDHERMEATSHQVTNILIEFDGDLQSAESEAYVTAALRDARTGTRQDRTIRGRYMDSWVRAGSRWLIARRTFQHDLTSITPAL